MKNILLVASEAVPFMKTGGLADVVGALPRYLDKRYFDCRVVIPKYTCMDENMKKDLKYLDHFYMVYDGAPRYVGILTAEVDGITYYFIDNEEYFGGSAPYSGGVYDIGKFVFFDMAVMAAFPVIGYKPDVIHCNDWQTGLIPVLVREKYTDAEFYRDVRTVMTIHNLKFQGIWEMGTVKWLTGLDDRCFGVDGLEFWGNANLLKGGIVYADAVTTVSETYSKEIQTGYYGEGLQGLMWERSGSLRGIVNGIDYDKYDPSTDTHLFANYSADSYREKRSTNKEEIQKLFGLKHDKDKFVIGMVSRMTDQKGFDLVAEICETLLNEDTQFLVLGTGEDRYQDMFRYFAQKYPDMVSANIGYSDELASRIYASCDGFLMPSRFEPCGLSQLIALRYGAVPIVRRTGGLADTVEQYVPGKPETKKTSGSKTSRKKTAGTESTGTGFTFGDYDAGSLLDTVRYARKIYTEDRTEWNGIVERGMKKDFSWKNSALKYQEMYDWLIDDYKR